MGPRRGRLDRTKRHFGVLTQSLFQEGKTREKMREKLWGSKGWRWGSSGRFPASSSSSSLPRPCTVAVLWTSGEGRLELAAHRTGQSNTNKFNPVVFSMSNMQLLPVTVSVFSSCFWKFLFTRSLLKMCLCYRKFVGGCESDDVKSCRSKRVLKWKNPAGQREFSS